MIGNELVTRSILVVSAMYQHVLVDADSVGLVLASGLATSPSISSPVITATNAASDTNYVAVNTVVVASLTGPENEAPSLSLDKFDVDKVPGQRECNLSGHCNIQQLISYNNRLVYIVLLVTDLVNNSLLKEKGTSSLPRCLQNQSIFTPPSSSQKGPKPIFPQVKS